MCVCVLTEKHVTFHSKPPENVLIPDTRHTASIFDREPLQPAHIRNGDETGTGVEEIPPRCFPFRPTPPLLTTTVLVHPKFTPRTNVPLQPFNLPSSPCPPVIYHLENFLSLVLPSTTSALLIILSLPRLYRPTASPRCPLPPLATLDLEEDGGIGSPLG